MYKYIYKMNINMYLIEIYSIIVDNSIYRQIIKTSYFCYHRHFYILKCVLLLTVR